MNVGILTELIIFLLVGSPSRSSEDWVVLGVATDIPNRNITCNQQTCP